MATRDSINTQVWGISTIGYGVIVQGLASIRQCIDIILRTRKKTDPFRPEFGSDISKYIDLPLSIAIPNIKRAIMEAIEIWEPRIKIVAIRHYLKSIYNPVFEIVYKIVDENLLDTIFWGLNDDTITSPSDVEIILQAFFPLNPKSYRYQIKLERNEVQALPVPPPNGFLSLNDLFKWVKENWHFYGRWFLLSDRLVLYMESRSITSATLAISVLPLLQVEAIFPQLDPERSYNVNFSVNGSDVTPQMPLGLNTPGLALSWVQNNWGHYGSWFIEYATISGDPVFTEEYSDEFEGEQSITQYKLILVSNQEGFNANLSITSI